MKSKTWEQAFPFSLATCGPHSLLITFLVTEFSLVSDGWTWDFLRALEPGHLDWGLSSQQGGARPHQDWESIPLKLMSPVSFHSFSFIFYIWLKHGKGREGNLFAFFPFLNVITRKFKITYEAHTCGSHCISIGQHWYYKQNYEEKSFVISRLTENCSKMYLSILWL